MNTQNSPQFQLKLSRKIKKYQSLRGQNYPVVRILNLKRPRFLTKHLFIMPQICYAIVVITKIHNIIFSLKVENKTY